MSDPCTLVELRVYDRDGVTLRDTVAATGGLSWTDPLGMEASAELTASLLQEGFTANPALFADSVVGVATNLSGTSTLTEVFGFLGEGGELTLVGPAEEADRQRALQCRGLLGLLDDWVLLHEGGIRSFGGDTRAFGWMSAASAQWFDEAQWSSTIEGKMWKDIGSHSDRYRKPRGWPDRRAMWVQANNLEKQYFRTTIGPLAEDTPVRIYCSADENLHVYLNGELIIANGSHEIGYTELNRWRGTLVANQVHTIGVKFLNEFPSISWAAPPKFASWDFSDDDRMIFTCFSLNADGTNRKVLRRSDQTHWLAVGLADGSSPPTWTAAGILGQALSEAVSRGVSSAGRITTSFTGLTDTSGVAFPDVHNRRFPVGLRGGELAKRLAEHDIDLDMRPGLILDAYTDQGSDVSATVKLQRGVNLTRYTAHHTPKRATRLYGRAGSRRWVQRTDGAAEASGDRMEDFLELGNSLGREQARHHLDRALEDTARDRFSFTGDVVAVPGAVPYLDFGKGDTVSAYDETGAVAPMRVVSIGGRLGALGGRVLFPVELEVP